ncbi:hypothetical protein ACN47E_002364 [Coniothyrium glycines]
MGDLPSNSRLQALDSTAQGHTHEGQPSLLHPEAYRQSDSTSPFYSQFSALPLSQYRLDLHSSTQPSTQYHDHEIGSSVFQSSSVASALPDLPSSANASQHISHTLSGASPSALAFHLGQSLQMPVSGPGNLAAPSQYGPNFASPSFQQSFTIPQNQQHPIYPSFGPNSTHLNTSVHYPNYSHSPQYIYYPPAYGFQGQYGSGYPSQGAQAMYSRRPSSSNTASHVIIQGNNYQNTDSTFSDNRVASGRPQNTPGSGGVSCSPPYVQAHDVPSIRATSSIPRGPPRKPKQSGHALWVGNLPPGTTILVLKDHFSRDATSDIESLFLISKSNCAFVNYRTEASCTAAMHRFHDSRFHGVRLVCRLRRSSTPTSGVPTGPAAIIGGQSSSSSSFSTLKQEFSTTNVPEDSSEPITKDNSEGHQGSIDIANKYFIVKSLTLQDLELSVRNGVWATQSHNEEVLNKAFDTSENVFLIFSANKSGEYFGYARMASAILEDDFRSVSSVPKVESMADAVDAADAPRSILTPATEWAPRGRIIDDSARGTIFWEAESPGHDIEKDNARKDSGTQQTRMVISSIAQSWGKPFKIQWLSTSRLPFYRTRGLRNPWNANREVKIARDGTELEPTVGERLIQMFHRMGPTTAVTLAMPPSDGYAGLLSPRIM